MSLETAEDLSPEEEGPASCRGNRMETDPDGYCQSIRGWDEIPQDGPRNDFPACAPWTTALDQRR